MFTSYKLFENAGGKIISVYHGLGGHSREYGYLPGEDRSKYLLGKGFTKVHYDYIDYDREWWKDKMRTMFAEQIEASKDSDVFMGFSLGGYTAYELAKIHDKPVILVNPALDRDMTKLDIKWFDIERGDKPIEIELYQGSNDTLIPLWIARRYLKRRGENVRIYTVNGMEHGTPMYYFKKIVNHSKILSKIASS